MTSLEMIGSWSCSLQCFKMQSGQPFRKTLDRFLRSFSHRFLDTPAVYLINMCDTYHCIVNVFLLIKTIRKMVVALFPELGVKTN